MPCYDKHYKLMFQKEENKLKMYCYDENSKLKMFFTEEELNNKEKFYWKLLHYKLFGDFYKTIPLNRNLDSYFHINSDDYLIKNEFQFKGENEFSKLWDNLTHNKNVILAGGYTTSMFFEQDFFESSDIDLFVNKQNSFELINFIKNNFDVIGYEIISENVMTMFIKNLRPIQIIIKNFKNVSNLLDDFDLCHLKCAFYLGNTYFTFDAKYAKENKITMSFQNVRIDRTEKAKKFGLSIFNKFLRERKDIFPNSENADKFFFTDYNENYIKNFCNGVFPKKYCNGYSFEDYKFTDSILYEEINIENLKNVDLSNIRIKPTRYNYHHYVNFYKMVNFNEHFQVPCILYITSNISYENVNSFGLEGVKKYKDLLSNIELFFKKINKDGHIYKKTNIYSEDDNLFFSKKMFDNKIYKSSKFVTNNKPADIEISSVYNNIDLIKNKNHQKFCLIFSKNEYEYEDENFSIMFNIFPSSANF